MYLITSHNWESTTTLSDGATGTMLPLGQSKLESARMYFEQAHLRGGSASQLLSVLTQRINLTLPLAEKEGITEGLPTAPQRHLSLEVANGSFPATGGFPQCTPITQPLLLMTV